jgi:hypothetical protein
MIPVIGYMVGAYIITRMAHLLIDKSKETNIITAFLAVITILVTLYALFTLATNSSEIASKLRF